MKQSKGFAVVYGLFLLTAATVLGTAILFMTQKDHVASADYAGTRISSMAAVAALKAFEGQCLTDTSVTMAALKKYSSNNNYKWFFGASTNVANSEQKISLGASADAAQYSARILSFDEDNSYIVIEARGYDGHGGMKKIIASYKLNGLYVFPASPVPTYAFYLGGALQNINAPTDITGDVYLTMNGAATSQHFNNSLTITGNLKTDLTNNSLDMTGTGPITVSGKAFMRCKMSPQSTFTVNGKAGFEKGYTNFTSAMLLKGNSFFNQSSDFSGTVNGNSTNYVRYNSNISASRFNSFSTETPITGSMSLADSLGMTAGDEDPPSVIIPAWGAIVKTISSSININATDVENWWTAQQSAGKLYKDEWLVVDLNASVTMTGGGPFTKKVIWITNNNSITVNKNWYDCAATSITMIYVNGNGFLTNMGVQDGKTFRGYIHISSSSANNQFKFGINSTFYGAITLEQGSFNSNYTSGVDGTMKIVYGPGSLGQSALQEIINIGLLNVPGSSGLPAPGLAIVDTKIRPMLINMQL
jgi:hypothetical protein